MTKIVDWAEARRAVEAVERETGWKPRADLTGLRYGKLVALSGYKGGEGVGTIWDCACDCGGRKVVRACHLRGGFVQSCGCSATESRRARIATMQKKAQELYTLRRIPCVVCGGRMFARGLCKTHWNRSVFKKETNKRYYATEKGKLCLAKMSWKLSKETPPSLVHLFSLISQFRKEIRYGNT